MGMEGSVWWVKLEDLDVKKSVVRGCVFWNSRGGDGLEWYDTFRGRMQRSEQKIQGRTEEYEVFEPHVNEKELSQDTKGWKHENET